MLELQTGSHGLRALVDGTQAIAVGKSHAVVERYVGPLVLEGIHRLNGDARSLQRCEEHREALVLGRVGIRSREYEYIVGNVRAAGEHLGSIDLPAVAVTRCPALCRKHVRA